MENSDISMNKPRDGAVYIRFMGQGLYLYNNEKFYHILCEYINGVKLDIIFEEVDPYVTDDPAWFWGMLDMGYSLNLLHQRIEEFKTKTQK